MLNGKIPFEIHITTDDFSIIRQNEFVEFCLSNDSKALIIELSKGEFTIQPMLSKIIYSDNFEDVFSETKDLSKALQGKGFSSKRLKIEVPAENYLLFQHSSPIFVKYFEWHGKINFINAEQLMQLCYKHKVHLSLNSLKNENNMRFITLREFGGRQEFERRIAELTKALDDGNWLIAKQQSEYCIYDNNNFLDTGWLPQ